MLKHIKVSTKQKLSHNMWITLKIYHRYYINMQFKFNFYIKLVDISIIQNIFFQF